ncbi:MAG: tRNA (adenosine(37)-N6)-threonylcarbamoyltransferase complex ATPase subunit type 1 TsaE [Hydrogenothermaceae bacterium]
MTNKFVIKNLEELNKFSEKFAKRLKGNEIILLKGDLGAGKTTFTKYLLKHLNIDDDVVSPTFTIMNSYQGKFDIYHIDMYRVDNFDISDLVDKGLIIIEWPKEEKFLNYKVPVYIIRIDVLDNESRIFEVQEISP